MYSLQLQQELERATQSLVACVHANAGRREGGGFRFPKSIGVVRGEEQLVLGLTVYMYTARPSTRPPEIRRGALPLGDLATSRTVTSVSTNPVRFQARVISDCRPSGGRFENK